jgi:hypothetical protein
LKGGWQGRGCECWQSALARQQQPIVRVDLTEVTAIDAAGRACLAALHRRRAEFIAADCLTKAVVAEITRSPSGGAQERVLMAESSRRE